MEKTAVLVIGAGPTGLMMACQLAIQKIPFIIVEKESGPTDESRALGIQARTLEIFAQMGIADSFVAHGKPASGLNFMANGRIIQHIPLTGLGTGLTKFPFLLTHEQSKTEANLVAFLKKHGQTILYSTEVLGFTQNDAGVTIQIKSKNGKESAIEANWLVGADGAHSIVRHVLGIRLAGKTYKQSLFVLDCKIESQLSEENVTVATSNESFAAFFPMAGNRWRIVGEVPPSAYGKDTITFAEVQSEVGKRLGLTLKLSDPEWISLYHAHHRLVTHFREGRAFLLGDASNIHSPIGAQGMNTGLQDAYNLAWKIAWVEQKKARAVLLDTFNAERWPFAKKLVATTDRLFNLFVSNNPLAVIAREYFLPLVVGNVISHKKTGALGFRTVSQIGISYHSSPLSQDASTGSFPKHAPVPGDRLPYLLFKQDDTEVNLQDLVKPTTMLLFLFPGKQEAMPELHEAVKPFHKLIHTTTLPRTAETESVYTKLGITNQGYYLIRPDMYIASRGSVADGSALSAYLHRFFLPENTE